jgi:predicted naringenin-chalcone synthase
MADAYIHRIATAVPDHDVHDKFVGFAPGLLTDPRAQALFRRMAERSGIEGRHSVLAPHPDPDRLDGDGFYTRGRFPDTATRMATYRRHAPDLAARAVNRLDLAGDAGRITHLITTSCTGFYAPGLDLEIIARFGLPPGIERTQIGFMGCQAAINALKLARHIVRSDPDALVLVLSLELCTLHLQDHPDLEKILSFLVFADGCAAALIGSQPHGLAIRGFHAALMPDSLDQITWTIGGHGFDMHLAGTVPRTIAAGLADGIAGLLGHEQPDRIPLWAVHPGGRSVLDAVETALGLDRDQLAASRNILRRYGNMSSPTILFVLAEILANNTQGEGCALAFGPGLSAEAMRFSVGAA